MNHYFYCSSSQHITTIPRNIIVIHHYPKDLQFNASSKACCKLSTLPSQPKPLRATDLWSCGCSSPKSPYKVFLFPIPTWLLFMALNFPRYQRWGCKALFFRSKVILLFLGVHLHMPFLYNARSQYRLIIAGFSLRISNSVGYKYVSSLINGNIPSQ